MLNKAFQRLNDKETPILHSDQGWHYQMRQYHQWLKNITLSKVCPVRENFFGLLKSELLYLKEFESMEQFKQELETDIHYYNYKRIKTKRKGLSPCAIQSSILSSRLKYLSNFWVQCKN